MTAPSSELLWLQTLESPLTLPSSTLFTRHTIVHHILKGKLMDEVYLESNHSASPSPTFWSQRATVSQASSWVAALACSPPPPSSYPSHSKKGLRLEPQPHMTQTPAAPCPSPRSLPFICSAHLADLTGLPQPQGNCLFFQPLISYFTHLPRRQHAETHAVLLVCLSVYLHPLPRI